MILVREWITKAKRAAEMAERVDSAPWRVRFSCHSSADRSRVWLEARLCGDAAPDWDMHAVLLAATATEMGRLLGEMAEALDSDPEAMLALSAWLHKRARQIKAARKAARSSDAHDPDREGTQ